MCFTFDAFLEGVRVIISALPDASVSSESVDVTLTISPEDSADSLSSVTSLDASREVLSETSLPSLESLGAIEDICET